MSDPQPKPKPDKPKPDDPKTPDETSKPDDPKTPDETKPDDPKTPGEDEPDEPLGAAKPTPTINFYGQTYEQIVERVLAGSSGNFQLMNPMQKWIGAESTVTGFVNPTPYRFVGQLPKWTATGTYAPGGSDVHQAYLQVLSLWNALGSGIAEDQVKRATKAVNDAQKQLADDTQAADDDYLQYKERIEGTGIPMKSYDDYVAEFWQDGLDNDRLVYTKALETLALLVGQKNPSLQKAIEAATPPTDYHHLKPGFVKYKSGSKIGILPNYVFQDPKEWVDRVVARGGTSLSIQLSASASSSAILKSWAGGDHSASGVTKDMFFALKGRRDWEKLDLAAKDKTVEVNITFKAYGMFEVGPDSSWYNSGLLGRLAVEDNWRRSYSTTGGHGKKPVFGKGGVFPLLVTSIIAGYQPSINITMSDATYKKYHERWNAAAGIQVGPFRIGGEGHSEDKWTKNTDGKKFHVESKATYPFIMGITVANPES